MLGTNGGKDFHVSLLGCNVVWPSIYMVDTCLPTSRHGVLAQKTMVYNLPLFYTPKVCFFRQNFTIPSALRLTWNIHKHAVIYRGRAVKIISWIVQTILSGEEGLSV